VCLSSQNLELRTIQDAEGCPKLVCDESFSLKKTEVVQNAKSWLRSVGSENN
jgi:hypothetical protein